MIENILQAFESLINNKMRALLTMLGIIIGIASVIAIMSMGDAMINIFNEQMQSFGANSINVTVRERTRRGNNMQAMQMQMLGVSSSSIDDNDLFKLYQLERTKETFSDEIQALSISESLAGGQVNDGSRYANVSVTGVNSDYFIASNYTMLEGRTLTDKDISASRNICVVSDRLCDNMFGAGVSPLGREIRFTARDGTVHVFTIVGVYEYEQQGMSMVSARDVTTGVFIPITTAKKYLANKNYSSFTVMTNIGVDSDDFTARLNTYLNRFYRSSPTYEAYAFNMQSMVQTANDMLGTITMGISVIAAISLVVGGIGVMNIMLVSVTERTREIGIRKALGAPNGSIRLQFVTEAMVVSMIGGVIGIIVGLLLGALGANILGASPVISLPTIALAVAFSTCIGIFFGLYPANKAAKLNPIDALRYE